MRKLRALWMRLRGLLRARRDEGDFADELASHVALHIDDGIRGGLTLEEARRQALIRLGGVEQTRQAYRERRGLPWLESLLQDIRYGFRTLRRSPGFAITAVLTLTLGLGVVTAMFTVINSVLLRPLPYPHPERIAYISSRYEGGLDYHVTRAAQYRFLQERSRVFESFALNDVLPSGVNLSGGGEPEQVKSALVSGDFFKLLGVGPSIGRAFSAEEDRPGGVCAVVLTDKLWRTRYNGDRSILRNPITINGKSCSAVGILPPSFRFHFDADMFMPLQIAAAPRDLGHYYSLLGRLRPEITQQQAREELAALFSQFKASHGDLVDAGEIGFATGRYQDAVLANARPTLWVLFGAACLMLLIACVNVAHLQFSRALVRSSEMALRAALGASRLRLARQLVTESALLTFAGAGFGLLLTYFGVPLLLHLSPSGLPRSTYISVDLDVVAFSVALSTVTLMVFGAAPAMSKGRVNVNVAPRAASHSAPPGKAGRLGRDLLIITEVALSLMLLTGAVLLMRSFVGLEEVDPGFDARNLLTFTMSLPPRYSTTSLTWEFERELLGRLNALPGVKAAASATSLPMGAGPDMPGIVLGQSPPVTINPAYRPVSPDYFKVLGTPLVRGRRFMDSDTTNSAPVAIINASLAHQIFADRNPLGQKIQLGAGLGPEYADPPRVIVGVAGDVRETSLDTPAGITVFIPRAQVPNVLTPLMNRVLPMSWAVRTRVPPAQLFGAIRQAILSVDAQQPAADMRTMEQTMSDVLDRQRFTLILMTIFASLATMMAAVGIYGVISYQIQQRTREVGIRMALGAQRADITLLVLKKAAALLGLGLVFGLAGSWFATRAIKGFLFDVGQHDPITIIGVCVLLAACGIIAALIPAHRAASVDPMRALRSE